MRRTRLRAGLLVVVAAALAGIGYEVSRTVGARRARTLADLGSDFLPTVAQHIRSFRRIKVEKGRTLWEITARDAHYYDKQDEIVVREPQMTLDLADSERRAHVSGTERRGIFCRRSPRPFWPRTRSATWAPRSPRRRRAGHCSSAAPSRFAMSRAPCMPTPWSTTTRLTWWCIAATSRWPRDRWSFAV